MKNKFAFDREILIEIFHNKKGISQYEILVFHTYCPYLIGPTKRVFQVICTKFKKNYKD